jgi:hypothetical protein
MRALVILALLATPAFANDTFEAKADGAQRIKHIDDVVWAFTATCDAGDDTQQRQCKQMRDARQAELANATLLVDADKSAFTVGEWNAKSKSIPLTLGACVDCSGITVNGKKWIVVGNAAGNAKEKLYDNARQAADDNAAKAFAKLASTPTVQLVVKVPAKPKLVVDGKNVFALDVLAYRVASACEGSVIAANPPAQPLPPNKKLCAGAAR